MRKPKREITLSTLRTKSLAELQAMLASYDLVVADWQTKGSRFR